MTESSIERGRASFNWALSHMPALRLAAEYVKRKSHSKQIFHGLTLAACLHVSKETSVLIHALHELGLDVKLVAANPLSSQPDIVSFLSSDGIEVRARRNETAQEYEEEIRNVAKSGPDLIVDDGGELHAAYASLKIVTCFGGTDETTSGTQRLASLEEAGMLKYPVIPVNEAKTKHLFDNRYGTGQSALDGLIRSTGLLLAGKRIVVAGYGWVGKGVAEKSRGMGAKVTVTEVDPIRALEAMLDGFDVCPMMEAVQSADVILTCTGQIDVLASKHLSSLKDGVILGNVGHFEQEIDVKALFRRAESLEQVRDGIARVGIRENGKVKSVYLVSQGRVINLAAAEGHPPEVMQLSFSNQLLSLDYLVRNRSELKSKKKVLPFPKEIDELVSEFALRAFNLKIDRLTARQRKYEGSFNRLVSGR